MVEGPPKTRAGARTIALDDATVTAMREWRAQQFEERLVMGVGWPKHDLVLTNADGRPVWPQLVTQESREIAAELELPLIGVHGLRHSAATAMISSGLNPRIVQQRWGHANVGITLAL